ncbi:HAD family hydrolase [filamentous cyanobacterium LEGE 11480]|uniref:HAD family hydrolase n=1 Tax=Romeriopsis navalis LEGE 11480 TaxID=2777977 RepID=A0A928VQE0_9CYAN|nr:HAD family hydrolase [Romeriopsis navalis LEGE 11480]
MSSQPELLALDFDGVLCDGLREYFQTAWQAHCELWIASSCPTPPDGITEAFYRLRPIVETGWEMPVIIHALRSGFSEAEILQDWANISIELLQQQQLSPQTVGAVVDQVRDQAIQHRLSNWLGQHRFYPGVIDRLQQVENFVIISTKEGRFIQQLLADAGIAIQPKQLFGKEQKRPKYEILRELKHQYQSIWFIEDRCKTLHKVMQQDDLNDVVLFLADWGYNLAEERDQANTSDRLHLIGLEQFAAPFEHWL